MTLDVRLYSGTGERDYGNALKTMLKPIIIDGVLYYIFDAQVYKYDFESGMNLFFMTGVSEVGEF